MSGRKQHFIPKHFLKGFIVPDGRDQLWMYRRNSLEPKLVSRNDVAAMRDFHSKSMDNHITDYEEENLASLVEKARNVSVGKKLCAHLIGEIGAHLMIRASYLRNFIEIGADFSLLKHLVDLFESLENLTPNATNRLLWQAIREDFDSFCKLISKNFDPVKQRECIKNGRDAHDEALEKESMAPKGIKTELEKFQWKVVEFSSGYAVLPDCVGIGKNADGWKPYILAKDKFVTQVIIPLSSAKLAVGSIENDWEEITGTYNQIARECSYDFYLMNKKKEVSKTDLEELGNLVRDMIADYTLSVLPESILPYENRLFKYNSDLLEIYSSTLFTTPDHETLKFHTEQAITHLNQMISTTTDAYTQYQTDRDHERYFETCAVCVSSFMRATTRYLAICAAFIGSHRPEVPLDEKLAQITLLKWLRLFEKDLDSLSSQLKDSINQKIICRINRHFERLLFEIGVLPDQLNDGSFFIHTFSQDYHLLPDDQVLLSLKSPF